MKTKSEIRGRARFEYLPVDDKYGIFYLTPKENGIPTFLTFTKKRLREEYWNRLDYAIRMCFKIGYVEIRKQLEKEVVRWSLVF